MTNTRRAFPHSTLKNAFCVGLGALALACGKGGKSAPPPPIVELTETADMDAEVVDLIDTYVDKVKSDEASFELRGDLGLAYEANMMFAEAEQCYAQAAAMSVTDEDADDKVQYQWRYREAIMKRRNGDLAGAVELMQSVSKAYTRSDFIWIRLGDFLNESGQVEQAEAAYRRAIELEPTKAYGSERLGRLLAATDRADEAVALLEQVVQSHPAYSAAHYALGQAYQALGKEDLAKPELQLGMDSAPGYPEDPHSGKLSTLGAGYGLRMGRIENMLAARQAEPAIQELSAILLDNPKDTFALNLMARASVVSGDPAKAIEWLQKSLDVDPASARTHLVMSEYQIYAGDAVKALEHAEHAAQLAPTIGMADYRRGIALLSNDRLEEAIEALRLGEEKGCDDPGLYLTLAQAYGIQQLFGESQKYALKAAERMPQVPAAQLTLCQASMGVNDYATARKALEAARALAPYDAGVIQLDNILKELEAAK